MSRVRVDPFSPLSSGCSAVSCHTEHMESGSLLRSLNSATMTMAGRRLITSITVRIIKGGRNGGGRKKRGGGGGGGAYCGNTGNGALRSVGPAGEFSRFAFRFFFFTIVLKG